MYPNKVIIYRRYVSHAEPISDGLVVESCWFNPKTKPPKRGITVKNLYLLIDEPYQRGRIPLPTQNSISYIPWENGEAAIVKSISMVLKSDNPSFKPGALVLGFAAAARYTTTPEWLVATSQVLPPVNLGVPLRTLISVLGIPELSVYASFFERIPQLQSQRARKPLSDMTVLVTGAGGTVGRVIGLLAKKHGMRIIGSASGPEKAHFVANELDYDASWDSKVLRTAAGLTELAPTGIDICFDNTGGDQIMTALTWMKDDGIIFSDYLVPDRKANARFKIQDKNITAYASISADSPLLAKHMPGFTQDMTAWISQHKITTTEEVFIGMGHGAYIWSEMMGRGGKGGGPRKMVLKAD